MIDEGIGTGTLEPRIPAGIGAGVNAGADGVRSAIASPLVTPARPNTASAVKSFALRLFLNVRVRMRFSFRSAGGAEADEVGGDEARVLRVEGVPGRRGADAARRRRRLAGHAVEE